MQQGRIEGLSDPVDGSKTVLIFILRMRCTNTSKKSTDTKHSILHLYIWEIFDFEALSTNFFTVLMAVRNEV